MDIGKLSKNKKETTLFILLINNYKLFLLIILLLIENKNHIILYSYVFQQVYDLYNHREKRLKKCVSYVHYEKKGQHLQISQN